MLTEATLGGVRPTGFRWGQTPNLPSGILCRLPRTADNTAAEAMCEKCPPATWKRLSCPFPVLNRVGLAWCPRRSSICIDRRYVLRSHAGHSGLAGDVDDVRVHGRVLVNSFFDGQEYLYGPPSSRLALRGLRRVAIHVAGVAGCRRGSSRSLHVRPRFFK